MNYSMNRTDVITTVNCTQIVNDNNIKFLSESNINAPKDLRHQYPLFLFSYGGSGNTVTRLLLEYITNIWTGSISFDPFLIKNGFKGQKTCQDVLAIKCHPEQKIQLMKREKRDFFLKQRKARGKSMDPPKYYSNMSAIFVLRNPWKAMFTLYTFYEGGCKNCEEKYLNEHTHHLWRDKWDPDKWRKSLRKAVQRYVITFKVMDVMKEFGFDYIVVKYENLIDLNRPEVQISEMNKILRYLYSDDGYKRNKEMLMRRMECLFPFLMKQDYQRLGVMHRSKANETKHVTSEMAYGWLVRNKTGLICQLWRELKPKVSIYGYQNLPGVNCTRPSLNLK